MFVAQCICQDVRHSSLAALHHLPAWQQALPVLVLTLLLWVVLMLWLGLLLLMLQALSTLPVLMVLPVLLVQLAAPALLVSAVAQVQPE